jgi:hypothetical protein
MFSYKTIVFLPTNSHFDMNIRYACVFILYFNCNSIQQKESYDCSNRIVNLMYFFLFIYIIWNQNMEIAIQIDL